MFFDADDFSNHANYIWDLYQSANIFDSIDHELKHFSRRLWMPKLQHHVTIMSLWQQNKINKMFTLKDIVQSKKEVLEAPFPAVRSCNVLWKDTETLLFFGGLQRINSTMTHWSSSN